MGNQPLLSAMSSGLSNNFPAGQTYAAAASVNERADDDDDDDEDDDVQQPLSKKQRRRGSADTNDYLYQQFTSEDVTKPPSKQGVPYVFCVYCHRDYRAELAVFQQLASSGKQSTANLTQPVLPKAIKRIPRDCRAHLNKCKFAPAEIKAVVKEATAHALAARIKSITESANVAPPDVSASLSPAVSVYSSTTPLVAPPPSLVKFQPTCDLYDTFLDRARVPCVSWRHYGGRKKFCGAAVTVKCYEDNSRIRNLVGSEGNKHRVLVVDGGGSMRTALLGDKLAAEAASNEWEGIVVYGCVRDVEELGQMEDLGIVALGSTPRKSVKRGEGQVGIAVRIGDVECHPGDFVFCDEDGVLLLSPQLAAEVVKNEDEDSKKAATV